MKHLLLLLSVIFAGTISAQTLQQVNADIEMPVDQTAMNGINSLAKSAACGPDTNGYALAKATGLEALNINSATSTGSASQYFDAPQSLTLSGVSFYAWKPDLIAGITMNATVEVYAAALDSTPVGLPLATTTVAVDTNFGAGALNVLRKHATFSAPITVTSGYVVVVSNFTATPMSMVLNSWTAGDGGQEWLSSFLIGGNWLRGYDVNLGGLLINADCLFEPHVSYNLTSSFLVDDPCFSTGLTLNFTNASSPVLNNRMYNIAAFQSITNLSYTWNYGDASPAENVIDASHTYGTIGAYVVTLTDTLYGWTTNCSTDTIVTLGGSPVADYTSIETGLTSTFTNTSASGAVSTYLWDLGDGNTSTLMDPVHTYTLPGTYTVCLTVSDACGIDSTCNTITVVCPIPTPTFTFAATGSTVAFTNTSTSGVGSSYFWIFGDGNTSTLMDPSHTYLADGAYTVCMVVSDACGADSSCQTVLVSNCVNPVAGFTSAETPTDSGIFDFTNTSTTTGTTTYAWDFGDGNTAVTMNASNTYSGGGTYTVTLTVTDSCGSNTFTTLDTTVVGIDDLSLIDVAVYPNPSNGIFTIEASANMKTAYITDLSGKLIYTEDLSGNEAIINAAQFANGTYFLSVRLTNDMIQTVRLEVVK
jgi:PKD repeat protein